MYGNDTHQPGDTKYWLSLVSRERRMEKTLALCFYKTRFEANMATHLSRYTDMLFSVYLNIS